MTIDKQEFHVNELSFCIRSAIESDAENLSKIRVQIDGETENLDREKGEAFIDEENFRKLILDDSKDTNNLFLVAEVHGKVVGFSRCEGNNLKRFSHKVEFGVCILKDFWNHEIGKNLLRKSISWADLNGFKKMTLYVLETNNRAIALYKKFGFEKEGILRKDKLLSDGNYYDTIVMGRLSF